MIVVIIGLYPFDTISLLNSKLVFSKDHELIITILTPLYCIVPFANINCVGFNLIDVSFGYSLLFFRFFCLSSRFYFDNPFLYNVVGIPYFNIKIRIITMATIVYWTYIWDYILFRRPFENC